jgi:hypothetical protein
MTNIVLIVTDKMLVGEEHQQGLGTPTRAGEDYKYSSARFYEMNKKDWEFLTHYNG